MGLISDMKIMANVNEGRLSDKIKSILEEKGYTIIEDSNPPTYFVIPSKGVYFNNDVGLTLFGKLYYSFLILRKKSSECYNSKFNK